MKYQLEFKEQSTIYHLHPDIFGVLFTIYHLLFSKSGTIAFQNPTFFKFYFGANAVWH